MAQETFPNLVDLNNQSKYLCPECDIEMYHYSCNDWVLDKCNDCGGIWFTKDSFAEFKRTLDSFDLSQIHEIYKPHQDSVYKIGLCPDCKVPLHEEAYSYKSNVTFHKCQTCDGFWLPLDQILNLVELSKLGQDISEEVKLLASEFSDYNKSILASKNLLELGQNLKRRITFKQLILIRLYSLAIPLYDENERHKTPYYTISIIGTLSLIMLFLFGGKDFNFQTYIETWAFVPKEIVSGDNIGSFFTAMVFHSGFFHLVGNLYMLWIFGDNVEIALGGKKFLALFFISGIMANLFHIVTHYDSSIPTLGASGCVSGLMGAYLYLYPKIKMHMVSLGFSFPIPIYLYLGLWFFAQVYFAVLYLGFPTGVAWWAHIGGFITGYVFAMITVKKQTRLRSSASRLD